MRPTTKIVLGGILFIYIISLVLIICFSFSERRYYKNFVFGDINIPNENLTAIDLEPYHTVILEEVMSQAKSIMSYTNRNVLRINPISVGGENKLVIPESLRGCIAIKTHDDTLKIQLMTEELRIEFGKGYENYLNFSGIDLCLHSSTVDVINKIDNFRTIVSDIETEVVKIVSGGAILIESCKAIDIEIAPSISRSCFLSVKNTVAKTINIDLDVIDMKLEEGCEIEEKNLTGGKRHIIELERKDRGKINWYPKNSEAELAITVPGDTVQIIFQ